MKRLICCSILVVALVVAARSQAGPVAPSSVPVHDLTIRLYVYDALRLLAKKFRVVIGVYGVHLGAEDHWVNISVKDGTLGEVFDAVVAQYPQLEWRQAGNGAVHFTFRDSPLSLLDVTIHSLDAESPGRMEAPGRLAEVPEVAKWLRDHGCSMGQMVAGALPAEWERFALHSRDVPFSAVLDEIEAKSGDYAWSAIQYRAEPCVINIRP